MRGLQAKLGKQLFSNRFVRKRKAHIRAFGSEIITAIDVLCLLLQVLDLDNVRPQFDIITKARLVLEVLKSGDAALERCNGLEAYMYALHCAFMEMYPQCATPKLHLMRHIAGGMQPEKQSRSSAEV